MTKTVVVQACLETSMPWYAPYGGEKKAVPISFAASGSCRKHV